MALSCRVTKLLLLAIGAVVLSLSCCDAANPRLPSRTFKVRESAASDFRTEKHISSSKSKLNFSKAGSNALSIRGGAGIDYPSAIAGSIALALIEKGVKVGLAACNLSFPAQLGGCILLLTVLLLAEAVNPQLSDSIFKALSPGTALLGKWLPVFFVPGLAMLPLAPSIGGSAEVVKVLLVVSLGFLFTLLTTTGAVVTLRKAQGTLITTSTLKKADVSSGSTKAFSDDTMKAYVAASAALGLLTVLATRADNQFATPIQTAFFIVFTMCSYIWGARLPVAVTKIVHPLVTASIIVIIMAKILAEATGRDFLPVLAQYRVKSLDLMKAGAGDIFLYLLGPAVVSFAMAVYARRDLLKQNLLVMLTGMLVTSVGGMYGTAAFVRLISLGGQNGDLIRLSVIPRFVTTALSMAIASMLGGDMSIAAIVVALSGSIGATYAKTILTALGVNDPVARGIATGSSGQGLGVASISDEPDAFPFAAVSMILTAIGATTLASIPAVKSSLIKVACGTAPKVASAM